MRLRQEQTVFVFAACLLGFLLYRSLGETSSTIRGGGRRSEAEFQSYAPPRVPLALPETGFAPPLARELFQPPRDTRPLPPLPLAEPPPIVVKGLLPPTDPGPSPQAFGGLLRSGIAPLDLPALFDEVTDEGDLSTDEVFLGMAERDAQERPRTLINPERDKDPDPYTNETDEERRARFEGYRTRYDWITQATGPEFGRIENEDRYGLEIDESRRDEPILWVRLNPDTGRSWYANIETGAHPVDREQILDFGLAKTASNEFEVRLLELGPKISRGTYDEALSFAGECVRRRLEAPRALEIAEGVYRRAAAFDAEDPIPRLGLAWCYESGFRFEEAFEEYNRLLQQFSHREEVHVRLARLEERFLLFDEAEARLRQALSMDRSSWAARFGLGGFLARRGRHEEAVEHLEVAKRNAPGDPNLIHIRVAIRALLADTYFALGRLGDAEPLYTQAINADPHHERSRAGLMALAFTGKPRAVAASASAGVETAAEEGFATLLAHGISLLHEGSEESMAEARTQFELAMDADPLRGDLALCALSYLAELTGHPEEALGYAEQARERNPTNAYALFQIGRLRGQQDDYDGAREALLAALEQELDFEDALVSLGEVAFRLGEFEDAERYFERAVGLNDKRDEVHTLRGLNHLRLGAVADARADFEAAIALDPENATAAGGAAWCTYLEGDSEQAVNQLAAIDDRRRGFDKEDPWRVWARAQMVRIQDHLEKVEWLDSFDRTRLLNDWQTREGDGPIVSMDEGTVKIEGSFSKSGGVARVYRDYPASLFVSLEADVWIDPSTDNVRAGLFIARELRRRNDNEIVAEAAVLRHTEGGVQVRFVRSAQENDVRDMEQPFPTGEWVRLRIERTGEASESAVTVSMDGIPLVENEPMASLGRASTPLLVGLFAEGDIGRQVLMKMENCAVVHRGAE